MLILTRKVGESITIGTDIRVVISQVHCGAVKVGIAAPREIKVTRTELLQEDKGMNEREKTPVPEP